MISRKQPYSEYESTRGKMPVFPEGTIFGASTSAYQVEGFAGEEGRGPSIWDVFSSKKGRIRNNDNGDNASGHYVRFREDINLMSRMGLDAYRFSISWPRVIPEGYGAVNRRGLDFYDRLVDELQVAGIRPFATLFHWDFPYQLYREKGGFEKREAAKYFAEYAGIVAEKLGDRVKDWITLNEPWVFATRGLLTGKNAPGRRNPLMWSRSIHNQLLAHAWAMERIKSASSASRVGISLNYSPQHPFGNSAADRSVIGIADQFYNRLLLDPLFKGEYPRQLMRKLNFIWPETRDDDMKIISRPMNFLGLNINSRSRVMYAPWIPFLGALFIKNRVPNREYVKKGKRYTSMGWEVYPESVYEALTDIKTNYGNVPVYITENGGAFTDKLVDYRVRDDDRIQFLYEHLEQAARAADEGSDLRGYFVRSFLDNFEWTEGYRKRFGIVYVDYKTQRRTIKDSGYWYKDLILSNRR